MLSPIMDTAFLIQQMNQGYLKIYQTDLKYIEGLPHPANHFTMVFEFTNLPDTFFLLCATSQLVVNELAITLTENDPLWWNYSMKAYGKFHEGVRVKWPEVRFYNQIITDRLAFCRSIGPDFVWLDDPEFKKIFLEIKKRPQLEALLKLFNNPLFLNDSPCIDVTKPIPGSEATTIIKTPLKVFKDKILMQH